MADNKTGLNSQYDAGSTPFGMSPAIGRTGAPGSPGVSVTEPDATLASVTVTPNFGSSQVPQPSVTVGTGDTSGFSDDSPVHEVPGVAGVAGYMDTGAGTGHVAGPPHPNAAAGHGTEV